MDGYLVKGQCCFVCRWLGDLLLLHLSMTKADGASGSDCSVFFFFFKSAPWRGSLQIVWAIVDDN